MSDKRAVGVGAHTRKGRAVRDYVQMRDARQERNTSSASMQKEHAGPLGDMADTHTYTLSQQEWFALIENKPEPGPPGFQEAYLPDGKLDTGKRLLVVSVKHNIVSHHDDPATEQIEEIPTDFDASERYQITVPNGAAVEYGSVRGAFQSHTEKKFASLVQDGTYGEVEVDSVFVQEWEVVPNDDPKKVWVFRQETWQEN